MTLAKHSTNILNWLASFTFYGEYKNVDLIMCTLVSVFERWHNSGCPFVIISDCQGINLFNSWIRIFQIWYSGFSVTHIIRTSLCLIVRSNQSIQDYFKIPQSIWNYFWIQFCTINQSEIFSGYSSVRIIFFNEEPLDMKFLLNSDKVELYDQQQMIINYISNIR